MDDYLVEYNLYNFSKTDLIYGYIIVVSLCTLYKYRVFRKFSSTRSACVQLEWTKLCPKVLYHFAIFAIIMINY